MGQVMSVTKRLTFDAAHRLLQYQGLCQNLHGHQWSVDVSLMLRGEEVHLDDLGMVKDFKSFKPLKEWIDTNWDHATIVNAADTELIAFLKKMRWRYFQMRGNPTAENMCLFLVEKAKELLADERVCVAAVAVWETPTSKALIVIDEEENASNQK